AHPTIDFGKWVEVEDVKSGTKIMVRITDRGPHIAGRVIDLTTAARNALGYSKSSLYRVRLRLCK
ncbi:MAG: septal ring lytic transglycosylase RlpA family protein, partial [Alphaproteobacteria bacterium]|nr:septal ring lytic transglycosylase RlpA family protein [Alphaproteobacteria bacterium]